MEGNLRNRDSSGAAFLVCRARALTAVGGLRAVVVRATSLPTTHRPATSLHEAHLPVAASARAACPRAVSLPATHLSVAVMEG